MRLSHAVEPRRGTFVHRPLCPQGKDMPHMVEVVPCAGAARPYVLAATILASAMAFIDGTVVTIALPALREDLGASFGELQWVVNAYALLLGALILVGGAAGDRLGRRRIFMVGIAVFAAASLACAIAPNALLLIAARALQGLGAALLVPQSLAIIAASFPKEVRGRAIGIWAGASAITTSLGPPLGGFLVDSLDWRAVFWINLPLSAAALVLTARYVPESRNGDADGAPLDWLGGLLAVLAFGLLTVGLTRLSEGPVGYGAGALMGFGLIGLVIFLRVEARTTVPLVPLSLFRIQSFSAANALTVFLYGALGGILFLLPFDLIERRGLSASAVGATMLPLGVIIGLVSRPAGELGDRFGARLCVAAGSLLVALAGAILALGLEDYWFGIMVPIVVLSLGMAVVITPLTTAVMNAAEEALSGVASGVNNAASRLAGLFGVAILGALAGIIFAAQAGDGLAEAGRFGSLPEPGAPMRARLEAAFLSAYGVSLWVTVGWSLLAALIAWTCLPGPEESGAQD